MSSRFEGLPVALVRAIQHAEASRGAAAGALRTQQTAPALSVALSREAGTGAAEVAEDLKRRLGWEVYDQRLLEQIAGAMNVRVGLLESVDERHVSWLQEALEMFAVAHRASESSYVQHLVETLVALAAHGNCVIVGRGSALLLPRNATLRVRLFAPLEHRVARIAHQRHLAHADAKHYVETTDRERIRFGKNHFQKDAADPQNYDLLLNTERFSAAKCAELIVTALQHHPHVPPAHAPLGR